LIVVTGGAGFIGSSVVWSLNQLGIDDIIIVDHLGTEEKWKNLSTLRFMDYIEKDEFIGLLVAGGLPSVSGFAASDIEAIIHLGACSSTTEKDASFLVRNNYEYSKKLASFALSNGIRFVYASSAATYGDGSCGFCDDESRLAMLRPLNMYGYSKHLFDLWALRTGALDKIVGLKYFNIFGPNEQHKGEMRSLVLKAYEQIMASGRLKLFKSYRNEYADGEQERDFLYVKDAAAMTIYFMQNRNANGIFNIGSGHTQTWNTLALSIFIALGKQAHIEYIDMPETICSKYQYYTCADIAKLSRSGYKMTTTPAAVAVEDYIKNYLVKNKRLGE
jgi:ADP-L-glycero-D-manno-heptose 6-epimerase